MKLTEHYKKGDKIMRNGETKFGVLFKVTDYRLSMISAYSTTHVSIKSIKETDEVFNDYKVIGNVFKD